MTKMVGFVALMALAALFAVGVAFADDNNFAGYPRVVGLNNSVTQWNTNGMSTVTINNPGANLTGYDLVFYNHFNQNVSAHDYKNVVIPSGNSEWQIRTSRNGGLYAWVNYYKMPAIDNNGHAFDSNSEGWWTRSVNGNNWDAAKWGEVLYKGSHLVGVGVGQKPNYGLDKVPKGVL
jgi:hypothetical protein